MHILLKASQNYKGILLMTHKEVGILDNLLSSEKQRYYIICHIGFDVSPPRKKYISGYMIPDSRYSEVASNKLIPFTSRNFLSKNFTYNYDIEHLNKLMLKYNINKSFNKKIDFLYVGRCVEFKKTIEVLDNFMKFNALNQNRYNIVFVILKQDSVDYYYKFLKKVEKYNSDKVILLDTYVIDTENNLFHGFNSSELTVIYKNAKVYVHGCEHEGHSKSTQEALLCGNIVLCKKNMKGGGLDFVTQDNSVLYTNNTATLCFKQALEKAENYKNKSENIEKIAQILCEKYTVKKFLDFIHKKFEYSLNLEDFYNLCNSDNLSFSIWGVNQTSPWYIKGKNTADIRSHKQIDILKKFL